MFAFYSEFYFSSICEKYMQQLCDLLIQHGRGQHGRIQWFITPFTGIVSGHFLLLLYHPSLKSKLTISVTLIIDIVVRATYVLSSSLYYTCSSQRPARASLAYLGYADNPAPRCSCPYSNELDKRARLAIPSIKGRRCPRRLLRLSMWVDQPGALRVNIDKECPELSPPETSVSNQVTS